MGIMANSKDKKPHLGDLMKSGQGLKGFEWPENCGDFNLRIERDGTWFYQNSPIGRKELCQLFATVLQKDKDGKYWLVTPYERGEVEVVDVPFTAVEMLVKNKGDKQKQVISFRTNLDYWVEIGSDNPLFVKMAEDEEPSPYIHVRDGLDALIVRSVFYDLVNLSEFGKSEGDKVPLIAYSNGTGYKIGQISQIDL